MKTFGGGDIDASVWASNVVPCTRLSRMRAFCAACPASGSDAFSGEVYDAIYVGEARGIEGIRRWIPGDFVVVAGIASGEGQDAITARDQCGFKCRADEARGTGYQDFHDGQLSGRDRGRPLR